jgi:DNA-3-methyladenine glycosylase II
LAAERRGRHELALERRAFSPGNNGAAATTDDDAVTSRPAPQTIPLRPRGPFSLAASSRFVEGFPAGQGGGHAAQLDLAFPVERDWQTVGVRVLDDTRGPRAVVVHNPGEVELSHVREQIERILSLDVDGTGFPAVGERDPVVRNLQQRYPGLRPVQFHTPYEAAAWTIIGQRIRMTQAAAIKTRLAEAFGQTIDFGDRRLPAFPAPDRLATLGPVQGLPERKVEYLRALGRAAANGHLEAGGLRGQPRQQALVHLRSLPGIGPFSAELVLLRGAGDHDAFPEHEKRLHRAMAAVYRLGDDPDLGALRQIADGWRPYRTWVALLLRTWLEEGTNEIASGRRATQLPEDIAE